jgi:hypothetical protein
MKLTPLNIAFTIFLIISIIVLGFIISLPLEYLLNGAFNNSTILQMIIFIPAPIIAFIHLFNLYRKERRITKQMLYTVIGYIIIFPIAFTVVVMFAAVILL